MALKPYILRHTNKYVICARALYKSDLIFVDKLCVELSILDTTKVDLIKKIADEKQKSK